MTAELPIIIAFPGDPDPRGQFLLGQTTADSFCLNVRVSHLHFIHLLSLRVLRNSLLLLYSQFAYLSSRIHIKIHTKSTGSFCAKYTFSAGLSCHDRVADFSTVHTPADPNNSNDHAQGKQDCPVCSLPELWKTLEVIRPEKPPCSDGFLLHSLHKL